MYSDIYSLPFFLRISNIYLFIVYGKVKRPARYDCALRVNKPKKAAGKFPCSPQIMPYILYNEHAKRLSAPYHAKSSGVMPLKFAAGTMVPPLIPS